jgi:RNA polymerase-binding transcription factor DksA
MQSIEEGLSYSETVSDQSELADYDQHPADAGTDTFEKEKDVSVLNSWRDTIGRIDEALDKLERGTYGQCDRCGREISEARLNAMPHAIYCMECQAIIEEG